MRTPTRIYVVVAKSGAARLVEAASRAEALRHVAGTEFITRVASQADIVKLMSAGVRVETPNASAAMEAAE